MSAGSARQPHRRLSQLSTKRLLIARDAQLGKRSQS